MKDIIPDTNGVYACAISECVAMHHGQMLYVTGDLPPELHA
jgi:hypothetical protein